MLIISNDALNSIDYDQVLDFRILEDSRYIGKKQVPRFLLYVNNMLGEATIVESYPTKQDAVREVWGIYATAKKEKSGNIPMMCQLKMKPPIKSNDE